MLQQSVTECYRASQSVTKCYRVLQSITTYYKVLQSMSEYCRVMQSIVEYYRVLQSIVEYCRVLHFLCISSFSLHFLAARLPQFVQPCWNLCECDPGQCVGRAECYGWALWRHPHPRTTGGPPHPPPTPASPISTTYAAKLSLPPSSELIQRQS